MHYKFSLLPLSPEGEFIGLKLMLPLGDVSFCEMRLAEI